MKTGEVWGVEHQHWSAGNGFLFLSPLPLLISYLLVPFLAGFEMCLNHTELIDKGKTEREQNLCDFSYKINQYKNGIEASMRGKKCPSQTVGQATWAQH